MTELELSPGFKRPSPDELPPGWIAKQLTEFCSFFQGGRLGITKISNYASYGVPAYSAAGQDGYVGQTEFHDVSAVILSSIGANCGRCFYAEGDWSTLANVLVIVPDETLSTKFLFYRVNRDGYWAKSGSAQPFIKPSSVRGSWIAFPEDKNTQQRIARILETIDRAIEKTEALIDKYQQIKAGLMHDLFTRGIGPNGQLRPPREQAPELYRETPIGWMPRRWEVAGVSDVLESLVDGPFGSNLKTEHYVEDPGIRVVRLQNVLEYEYNDSDRAYISEEHASRLTRNQVVSNDVLIAGLGEERFPVGRSCSYPRNLAPAVNKADCFRARCISSVAINKFFMLFLNSAFARKQVRKFEQGVTRPRINTGNLRRLRVPVPTLGEQRKICEKFDSVQQRISVERRELEKLLDQKAGLMHDLLTGTVPVRVEAEEGAESAHV